MKNNLRFSLRKKTVLIIILMAILLSGAAILTCGLVFSRASDENYRLQASELAATIASVVDPDQVADLREQVSSVYDATEEKVGSEEMDSPQYNDYLQRFASVTESDSYREVYQVLRGIQDANHVESVYILYVDVPTRSTVYLVDASDDPCYPGNFDPVYEMNDLVLENPEVGFPAYITNTEAYGWLVSAGVAIHDSEGNVIAHAFTDISMNDVKNSCQYPPPFATVSEPIGGDMMALTRYASVQPETTT